MLTNSRSLVELAGGESSRYHPNFDVRRVQGVDVQADLESFLPIRSDVLDFVYCSYAVEHISWRKVKGFLAECFRVLKAQGELYLVTANLLEQARVIVNKGVHEMNDLTMIFGDLNYEANTHKSSMPPDLMERCLREVGFSRVRIEPHILTPTDMIVQAWK